MHHGQTWKTIRAVTAFAIAFLLFIRSSSLFGQATETEGGIGEESGLSAASLVSAAFPMTSTVLTFVPLFAPETAGIIPWIANPLLLGAHVPLYWINPSRALGYSIAGLALPAAGIGLMFVDSSIAIAQPISATLLSGYSHLMQYAAYDTYRLGARGRGGYDLAELVTAPF
jgi:hypothetical protein